MKIRKGDQIKIITGKDRGKSGKVVRVIPEDGRLIVEGLNLVKKHARPKRTGEKGQVIEVPRPLAVSKVMLVCPQCGKPTRVGHKTQEGKKYRICKKCQNVI